MRWRRISQTAKRPRIGRPRIDAECDEVERLHRRETPERKAEAKNIDRTPISLSEDDPRHRFHRRQDAEGITACSRSVERSASDTAGSLQNRPHPGRDASQLVRCRLLHVTRRCFSPQHRGEPLCFVREGFQPRRLRSMSLLCAAGTQFEPS